MRKYFANRASIVSGNVIAPKAFSFASSSAFSLVSTASVIMSPQDSCCSPASGCYFGIGAVTSLRSLHWSGWQTRYMSIYNRLRLDIKREQVEIKAEEGTKEQRKAA